MGDPLRKVRSGEKLAIPAETFNTFIDAARDLKERRQRRGTRARQEVRQSGVVPVRNDSGADRERFEVLGVDSLIYGPADNEEEFKNRPALVGVTPTEADHAGRFVVLTEPVADGGIGRALAAGVSPVRVDVTDPEHGFADVADGDCGHLAGGSEGAAQVLWKGPGTGVLWALVRFPAGGGGGGGIPRWQPAPP